MKTKSRLQGIKVLKPYKIEQIREQLKKITFDVAHIITFPQSAPQYAPFVAGHIQAIEEILSVAETTAVALIRDFIESREMDEAGHVDWWAESEMLKKIEREENE